MCESTNNYSINTGNGYYGAWQFDYPSWHANGGGQFAEYPHQATPAQQDFVAYTYWLRAGWGPGSVRSRSDGPPRSGYPRPFPNLGAMPPRRN